jgi:hypothetical protein
VCICPVALPPFKRQALLLRPDQQIIKSHASNVVHRIACSRIGILLSLNRDIQSAPAGDHLRKAEDSRGGLR